MYESETQELIQSRTLARVDNSLDKREGSLIQTAVGPLCAELAQMYISLDGVIQESFADTQSREYLIRRAAERGLAPKPATNAIVKGVFNLATIPAKSRFACGDFVYVLSDNIASGQYKLICETAGTAPNGTTGTLLPLTTITGLTSAEIDSVLVYGTDDEDTEVFRQRYFDSFDSKAFGGNRADYVEKTLGISGVGAVKVYRASSVSGDEGTSGGNVRLVILDGVFGVPSSTLVSLVKNTFDPADVSGYGYGLAPMWHHVYVEAAGSTACNLTLNLTYADGYVYADVESQIKAAIDAYLLSLAKEWANNSTGLIVRITYIQSAVISIEGILDCTVTSLNGGTINLVIDKDSIPVRGVITCN